MGDHGSLLNSELLFYYLIYILRGNEFKSKWDT